MAEKRFLDFLDRIDGGGMGQRGDTFEGGGLLSMLGNMFASPYGSQDPERRARRDAFYAGQMGEPMAASGFNSAPVRTASELATGGDQRPAVLRQGMQPAPYQPQAPSPLEQFGGQPPAPYQPQAPSPLEQFGGQPPAPYQPQAPARDLQDMQQRANYAPTRETQTNLFLAALRSQHGSDKANAIAKSPFALDLFKHYIRNGYRLPLCKEYPNEVHTDQRLPHPSRV